MAVVDAPGEAVAVVGDDEARELAGLHVHMHMLRIRVLRDVSQRLLGAAVEPRLDLWPAHEMLRDVDTRLDTAGPQRRDQVVQSGTEAGAVQVRWIDVDEQATQFTDRPPRTGG